MSKLIKLLLICCLCVLMTGCGVTHSHKRTIVTTSFPCYDFVRAVVGDTDTFEVKMLLKPGQEMHDYDPTPHDQIALTESDLIVCVGGESESWMEDTIDGLKKDVNVMRMMELVTLKEEELKEGMEAEKGEAEEEEDEVEYDEHVWTSLKNAVMIIDAISHEIATLDDAHKDDYLNNAHAYCDEIKTIDHSIQMIVNQSNRKTLYFGDRFPLRYFVDDYGLDYYAAFPGCSEQTEPSAKTLSQLIERVRQDQVKMILTIELSNGAVAKTIAEETGCTIGTFQSAHNIALDDFNAGKTYVDLMKDNAEVLKEALK